MAKVNNGEGKVTLSFWREGDGTSVSQLKSSGTIYDTVADAWNAAVEALDRFPQISYVHIDFQPVGGHPRTIEKINRGPLF